MPKKLFYLLLLLLPVQVGRHWWPKWAYLYGLRVDYWAPTLHLTDIIVFLIFIFYFQNLKSQISKLKTRIQNRKSLLVFLIFIFLIISSLLAGNREVAFLKLIKILELFFLGYYVAKNNYTLNARRYLLVGVIYSSLIALGQFLKQRSLGGIFWWLGERSFTAATPGIAKMEINGQLFLRPYTTFSHPNALAGFLLVSLILTLPWVWQKSKLLTVSYLLLTISALALTFSRPVWLIGVLVLLFGAVQLIKPKKLLFSFLFLTPESFFRRQDLNEMAVQLIKSQPIFGVGLNNFLFRLPFSNFIQPVHNIYLLVASETGIIIFIIFIIFIIKTIKKSWENWAVLGGLEVILFTGLFDHYWLTLQQNQLLLAIVFGLCWQTKASLRVSKFRG